MKKILLTSLLFGTVFSSQINAMEAEISEKQKYTGLVGMLGLYDITPQNIAIIQDAYRGTYNAEPADINTISDLLKSQELDNSSEVYTRYAELFKKLEITDLTEETLPTIQGVYAMYHGAATAPEGVVRQIFNKEQSIQHQAADKVEEIYKQQHAIVPAPAQPAQPPLDEARAIAATKLLVNLSTKRRGEDRMVNLGECRKLEKVPATRDWQHALTDNYVRFIVSGRLLGEVSEIVSLVLESMKTPECGIYLPDFIQRKQLFSAWIELGKLETRGCMLPQERVGLLQKYIGTAKDEDLRSFTSNPNISYHLTQRKVAWWSDRQGKMCFLNINDLVTVFEEVAGNWANRHGDFISPAQMFADLSIEIKGDMLTQSLNILELAPDCTWDDVKAAYKRLALIHHPDKGGNEEKFKELAAAYSFMQGRFDAQNQFKDDMKG